MEERFDLGYVVWADANLNRAQTHTAEHRSYLLVTGGLIVKNDKTGVTIAQDVSEDGSMRETAFIPRENIRDVRIAIKDVVRRRPQMVMFPAPTKKRVKRGKKGG